MSSRRDKIVKHIKIYLGIDTTGANTVLEKTGVIINALEHKIASYVNKWNAYSHVLDMTDKRQKQLHSKLRQSGRDFIRLGHMINMINNSFNKQLKLITQHSAMLDVVEGNAYRMEDAYAAVGDAVEPLFRATEPFVDLMVELIETNPYLAQLIGLFMYAGNVISWIATKFMILIGTSQIWVGMFPPGIRKTTSELNKMAEAGEKATLPFKSLGIKAMRPLYGIGGKGSRDVFISDKEFNKLKKIQQEQLLQFKSPRAQIEGYKRFTSRVTREKYYPAPPSRKERMVGAAKGGLKGIAASIRKMIAPLMALSALAVFMALFGETIQEYFLEPLTDFIDDAVMERLKEAMGKLLTTIVELITNNPMLIDTLVQLATVAANVLTVISDLVSAFTKSPPVIMFFTDAASKLAEGINFVVAALTLFVTGIQTVIDGWTALFNIMSSLNPFSYVEANMNRTMDTFNRVNTSMSTGIATQPTIPPLSMGGGTQTVNVNVNVDTTGEIELYGSKYEGGEGLPSFINPITRTTYTVW